MVLKPASVERKLIRKLWRCRQAMLIPALVLLALVVAAGSFAQAGGEPRWHLASDFRTAPNQSNPNPDSHGNPGVWQFMEGAVLHDPSSYGLLEHFIPNAFGIQDLQQWQGDFVSIGALDQLPAVGINATGADQFPSTIGWPSNAVRVHPLRNTAVVVGWTSTVAGNAHVEAGFSDLDNHGGDGVDWFVDDGSATLASGELPNGGTDAASLDTTVSQGDDLYFIVTDGGSGNHNNDSTRLDVTITSSDVALVPSSIAFDPTVAGGQSVDRTVTFSNNSGSDVAISAVALAGADASSFATSADTCAGATLPTTDTCTVAVRFQPERVGAHAASLEFTDDASGSPHSVALSGTGISPVTVSPSSIAFNPRPDSTKGARHLVTLRNLGADAVAVNGVALTGSDASSFRLPPDYDHCTATTLSADQTCDVRVRFRPDGVGSKSASLTFTDDSITSPHTVALSGTGTPGPWLTRSLQGLRFGRAQLGTTTAPEQVTLTNTGSAPMAVSSISPAGADPADFVNLSEGCTSLASLDPDESCTAEIAFRPTANGARTARLTITHDAPRSPRHVELYGRGPGS